MSRRILAAAVALATMLTGCSAADRALITAQRCGDDEKVSLERESNPPGQVIALERLIGNTMATGPVTGWNNVVSVANARTTAAAVHADGTVSVIGSDHEGLLGTATDRDAIDIPARIPGITDAVSVEATGSAFMVVMRDGSVLSWGEKFLASGGKRDDEWTQPIPTPVPDVTDVVEVVRGSLNSLALRSDGRVLGWGINLVDILGDPSGTRVRTLKDLPPARSLANASGAGIIATGSGRVCAWGNNVHGLLGVEPTGGQTPNAVTVPGLSGITDVAGGSDFALALDEDGAVWSWGRNASGSLGYDTDDDISAVPQQVPGLPPIAWIGASDGFTGFAVDRDGGLWVWGPYANSDGLHTPRPVPLPGTVTEVAGSMVLLENGTEPAERLGSR